MGTNVNFGQILENVSEAPDYSPLPDGDYDLTVMSCDVATTQTGKYMLKLKTQVSSGAYERRLLWDNLVFSTDNPKAMGIIQGKLNALGLTPDYLKQNNPDLETIANTLVNRNFRAKVGQSEYQGKMRNEMKAYYAATTQGMPPAAAPASPAPQMAAGAAVPPPPPAPVAGQPPF
jgi:hypothetical protein